MVNNDTLREPHTSTKKAVIFSVILTCLALVLGESGVRVWAYYFRTPYERFNPLLGRYELIPNTRFTTAKGTEFLINSAGFVGPEFETQKPGAVYRIFALGDSCTFGYWKQVYPGILQLLLNSRNSAQRFEVINAGIEGYNSDNVLARLKQDVLQYRPDMVIIYVGWNDLMKVNPNNLSATGRYTWITSVMERSYLMKAYTKLIFYYLRPLVMKPELHGGESDIHAFDRFVPFAFQQNLESMIEILHLRDITPLLVTLPTVVRPGMSYRQLERESVFFPYYAGTYSVAKMLSLHRSYNNAIRRTGLKYSVPVADVDAIFNRYNKEDLFLDTMHPSTKGHTLIAQSMVATIQDILKRRQIEKPTPRPY